MKQVKKNYIIKYFKDGEIINEVKLKNSKKKILINKFDRKTTNHHLAKQFHDKVQSLHPKLTVLTIPNDFDIEIYEIID